MKNFFETASRQNHPIRALDHFLGAEKSNEAAKQYQKLRFVGYALDIGFDTVTIITSDPYKIAVGGVPRNSMLVMVPAITEDLPPHFTLLRVLESAPTPLSQDVQQTYFELQKKSMPELDVFTQSELQWGALRTAILGMYYPHPDTADVVEFSGDINNFVSAHKYKVYSPDSSLLDLIVNGLVPQEDRVSIGNLRLTECRLSKLVAPISEVPVYISARDFTGTRTAMFGKTRLGKSNVVKLIAETILQTNDNSRKVGQLIFDVNGEYANDNPQDGSSSLKSAYSDLCSVYALTKKSSTESKPLRLDFYEHPESSLPILNSLLKAAGKDNSNYISSFLSVDLRPLEELRDMDPAERKRAGRKILFFWAILTKAGYRADDKKLRNILSFDPQFNEAVRSLMYPGKSKTEWPKINDLDSMVAEVEAAVRADRLNPLQSSTKGKSLFDSDDQALLGFLFPRSSSASGPNILQSFRIYHDANAGDFVTEIIDLLENARTVILDLGNAPPEVMTYFANHLSRAVFFHQVDKFSNNKLNSKFVQLYFEEAHNLFPAKDEDETPIYQRIAKEGAKYHIGMVYSTQSVTTINRDLLAQTENFFIAHMSSQEEVNALARLNVAYQNVKDDILQARTPGYMRVLTRSHRFVIPLQAKKFEPVKGKKV